MTLFIPVGMIMDRWGRKWTGVPCLLIMSIGLMLVPLTGNFLGLMLIGLVTGFGNGFGSGIIMTLGADFSPSLGRGEFLGIWRLVSDIGTSAGPAVVGGVAGIATLGVASVVTGGLGLAGAAVMVLFMAEPLKMARVSAPP
jgi:MFS family permease